MGFGETLDIESLEAYRGLANPSWRMGSPADHREWGIRGLGVHGRKNLVLCEAHGCLAAVCQIPASGADLMLIENFR
jgi:hypothetical protein